jgi:hypothetical protein
MGVKALAEAIMLQAAEDFLKADRQEEDVLFFGGEGFRLCSEMAEMDYTEKCAFLDIIRASAPVRYPEKKKSVSRGNQRVLQI